ncbi:type II secretion system protein N [Mangrovimicrobium sediminis]|uniref:Type II secretion system protein N n=1 Tax=Mangrovimicrobium sediminis TaxID=2562682 RepID=A0A4Z0M3D8_9GAMM|nr:type II secretion system protein N [Haliea sp. SAOS-164]TGD74021.1 type II secretion system protein N [Haliea sp. SAOS-164]
MLPRWLIALILGLLLLVALVATAPARLLPLVLPAQQVQLEGLSGTLWRGAASRATLLTAAGGLQLGRTEWRLRPLSLLLLSPAVEFSSNWGAQTLAGIVRTSVSGNIDLRDLDARVDAALLSHFVPVRLGGDVSLQFARLRVEGGLPSAAEGRLVWQGGSWNAPQGPRALGSYAMDVTTGDDGTIRGEVITLSGEVEATGSVSFAQRAYGVDVGLRGAGLDDPQLRRALQLMAAPQDDGFRLQLQGSL